GRCGWRDICVTCQLDRLAKMLSVSVRLFSCRREISSVMFSALSLPTSRSSSILACKSAIGCSNSRYFWLLIISVDYPRPPAGRPVLCVTLGDCLSGVGPYLGNPVYLWCGETLPFPSGPRKV